jgi:hypothetical protein
MHRRTLEILLPLPGVFMLLAILVDAGYLRYAGFVTQDAAVVAAQQLAAEPSFASGTMAIRAACAALQPLREVGNACSPSTVLVRTSREVVVVTYLASPPIPVPGWTGKLSITRFVRLAV